MWLRNSGETESDGSGPERDHTTDSENGWYLYVPEDAQSNGVAVLQSELLGPYSSQMCFSFYYHIMSETYRTAPKLTVQYVSPQITGGVKFLGNVSSKYLNRWLNFNVTLPNLPLGRFQLKTIKGQLSEADVAIDDITIKYGSCAQPVTTAPPTQTTMEPVSAMQWDCNFETATVQVGAQRIRVDKNILEYK